VNTERLLETSFIHLINKYLGIDTSSSCHCRRYISVITPNFPSARYMDVASFVALGVFSGFNSVVPPRDFNE
jgi:hypothetical protein